MIDTSCYNKFFWRIAKDMSNIFFVKLTYVLDNWVRLTKQTVRSVKRLAAGWRFRCPIPGGGIMRQTDTVGPTNLSLLRLPNLDTMNKAAGAFCWRTVPSSGEVKMSRLSIPPLCILRHIMGWPLPFPWPFPVTLTKMRWWKCRNYMSV